MSIDDQIRDFKNGDLDQAFRKWDAYVIKPYALAYNRAFDSFKKTLDTQSAFDKMEMELVFTALSICGGSIFTTVFGAITAKKLAGEVALDFICKNNLERAFKLANFVSENKTAEFIIGEVWDKSSSLLGNQVKNAFQENASNFTSIDSIIKKPYEVQAALELFQLNCQIAYYEALKALLGNTSDSTKSLVFDVIKKSPMCCPPDRKYYPENYEDYIELGFYMRLVLNTDQLVTRMLFPSSVGVAQWAKVGSKTINTTPDKADYPTSTTKLGFLSSEMTSVEYDRVGQYIIDRINILYKRVLNDSKPFIDSNWFGEQTNKNVLFKATQVLNHLGTLNSHMIQQQSRVK
jgi:hypothetical protein